MEWKKLLPVIFASIRHHSIFLISIETIPDWNPNGSVPIVSVRFSGGRSVRSDRSDGHSEMKSRVIVVGWRLDIGSKKLQPEQHLSHHFAGNLWTKDLQLKKKITKEKQRRSVNNYVMYFVYQVPWLSLGCPLNKDYYRRGPWVAQEKPRTTDDRLGPY